MGIMNHMLNFDFIGIIVPDKDAASDTNSVASIQAQVDLCVGQHRIQPHVILVSFLGYRIERGRALLTNHLQLDWIDVGEAMEAEQVLNGL